MVELVDTLCSGRSDRMVVRVQLSLPAPHSIAAEPVSTGREREPKGSLFFFPPRPRPSLRFFSFAFLSFFLLFSSLFFPPPRALFFDSSFIPLASTRPDRRLGGGLDPFEVGLCRPGGARLGATRFGRAWGPVQAWIFFFFWGGGVNYLDVLPLGCLALRPDWVPNPARRRKPAHRRLGRTPGPAKPGAPR